MPHDKNGQVLGDGDLVSITARVKSVSTGEEYCNVTLETVEAMYPGDSKSTMTLNAKQVELIEKAAPAPALEEAKAEYFAEGRRFVRTAERLTTIRPGGGFCRIGAGRLFNTPRGR